MNYSEKLKSPKWQRKRLEVLNRDNFKCCSCGDEETELHVHHLKYNGEPYDAPVEDLQTLCKHCHKYFTFEHNKIFNDKKELESNFVKIHKTKDSIIAEFENCTILFLITENELQYVASFCKFSVSLDLLHSLNNTI